MIKIRKWLLASNGLNCKSLTDFQFAVHGVAAAEAMADANGFTGGERLLQVSRIRQAAKSLEDAARQAELLKAKGVDETDLDALLPSRSWMDSRTRFGPGTSSGSRLGCGQQISLSHG